MSELRFMVMVRREGGEIYNSDKYETEYMTFDEIIDAFADFVENAISEESIETEGVEDE